LVVLYPNDLIIKNYIEGELTSLKLDLDSFVGTGGPH
jgi:hypothetical protein